VRWADQHWKDRMRQKRALWKLEKKRENIVEQLRMQSEEAMMAELLLSNLQVEMANAALDISRRGERENDVRCQQKVDHCDTNTHHVFGKESSMAMDSNFFGDTSTSIMGLDVGESWITTRTFSPAGDSPGLPMPH